MGCMVLDAMVYRMAVGHTQINGVLGTKYKRMDENGIYI